MRKFGNHELVASLASGGMSSVWLTRSPGADGIVVLKRLLRTHLGDPDIVAMFQNEAELGELLRHPNLIRTYEHGVAEGEPYIVMERLEGEDMRTIRRVVRRAREKIPLEVSLEVLIRACHGLHAAHEAKGRRGEPLRVVHRDVSPHNIIVTFEGDVKVLDFGVAKSENQRVETRDGVLKGKIPYMAPEQIRAEKIDRRTDIYALGVVLYELTAGERPYFMPAPSEFALMMAIVRGDIRFPSAVVPDYPADLESIVMRALSGNPERRHPTAAVLAEDLEAFRDRARLRGGRQMLAEWMRSHFAERIESLRAAASPDELAARLADADKRRRATNDDGDGDAETAPRAPPTRAAERRSGNAQYTLTRRPLATAVLATLSGRLNESFDSAAAGQALAESKLVVLDLAGVDRITSYGVREWTAMLAACKGTELWLARCSEAIVAQLSTIKGFAGHARVASLLLSFRCDACGASFEHTFDLEADAKELSAGAPAPRSCAQCGSDAKPEDDAASLLFMKRWLGKPVPHEVRAALSVLWREGGAPPPVEKIVLGTETQIRLRRGTDRRLRFGRLLDGIEGDLRINIRDASALDDRAGRDLARALLTLGPEVTSIRIHGATRELVLGLGGSSRVEIVSTAQEKDRESPPPVVDSRAAVVDSPVAVAVVASPVVDSPVADSPVAVADSPAVAPRAAVADSRAAVGVGASPAKPAARPAAAKVETDSSISSMTSVAVSRPKPKAPPRLARLAPALVVAALLVAVFFWTQRRAPGALETSSAAPSAASSVGASAGTLAAPSRPGPPSDPAPKDRIEKTNGSREITAVGAGPTDDAALSDARSRAVALLVDAVRAALPEEIRATIRPTSERPAAEIAERFLAQMGPSAAPERTDTKVLSTDRGHSLAARFRVSDAVFDQAVARFGTAAPFRGARVVPVFPTVAGAGWIVVTAPSMAEVHPGDRVVAIGALTLAPSDLPDILAAPAPEVRVARGDSLVSIPWVP